MINRKQNNEEFSRTRTKRFENRVVQKEVHASFYGLREDIINYLAGTAKKFTWPNLSTLVEMLEKKRPADPQNTETVQSLSGRYFPEFVKYLDTEVSNEERTIDYHNTFSKSDIYSDGCNPDISHPLHNNLCTISTVVCLGYNKRRRSNNSFTSEEKELLVTYALRWLSEETYRSRMIVYLTDIHFIQFFSVTKQIIHESDVMLMKEMGMLNCH
jgi:hypothetical protein